MVGIQREGKERRGVICAFVWKNLERKRKKKERKKERKKTERKKRKERKGRESSREGGEAAVAKGEEGGQPLPFITDAAMNRRSRRRPPSSPTSKFYR